MRLGTIYNLASMVTAAVKLLTAELLHCRRLRAGIGRIVANKCINCSPDPDTKGKGSCIWPAQERGLLDLP